MASSMPLSVMSASTAMKPVKPSSKPILRGSPVAAGAGEPESSRAPVSPESEPHAARTVAEGESARTSASIDERDFLLHSLSPPVESRVGTLLAVVIDCGASPHRVPRSAAAGGRPPRRHPPETRPPGREARVSRCSLLSSRARPPERSRTSAAGQSVQYSSPPIVQTVRLENTPGCRADKRGRTRGRVDAVAPSRGAARGARALDIRRDVQQRGLRRDRRGGERAEVAALVAEELAVETLARQSTSTTPRVGTTFSRHTNR